MRKLGKKVHEMQETVEAYCKCDACYLPCSCNGSLQSSSNDKTQWGANFNVGNGTVYSF